MIKIFQIQIFFVALVYFSSCDRHANEIETIALVVPQDYEGEIIIFYDQDSTIGKIEVKNGKHYFHINEHGIFFTKRKLGVGTIEYYNSEFERLHFISTMELQNSKDLDSYEVVGGEYAGVLTKYYKNENSYLRCSLFRAGKVKDLRNNWRVSDSRIVDIYESYFD